MFIANIKLAIHGGMEAMNAVLISSITASAFNIQLESWELLVEAFDGIFKFETFDTNSPSRLERRMPIATSNIVNIKEASAHSRHEYLALSALVKRIYNL
ncbi:hypothetical protein PTKIN_Ptkin06aG0000200 [Pterospermum kingtungense]